MKLFCQKTSRALVGKRKINSRILAKVFDFDRAFAQLGKVFLFSDFLCKLRMQSWNIFNQWVVKSSLLGNFCPKHDSEEDPQGKCTPFPDSFACFTKIHLKTSHSRPFCFQANLVMGRYFFMVGTAVVKKKVLFSLHGSSTTCIIFIIFNPLS